ncbi:ZIP family metal transporter [Parasphingorhabdus pacifica]
MTLTTADRLRSSERVIAVGTVGTLAGLCVLAGAAQLWKLVVIAVVSCLSMVAGGVLGSRTILDPRALTWAYGVTAGAMVTSACAFVLPTAIGQEPKLGGFGIAVGVLAGFAMHIAGDRLRTRAAVLDDCVLRLTVHSVAAGIVIGAVYANMPSVGLLLGLSIVSHKGPAGYAAARSLHLAGQSVVPVVLPACAVGIAALVVGLLGWPLSTASTAMVFGFGAGLFLHVALDFLAHLEGPSSAGIPRLPGHATASAVTGGVIVVLAWAIIGG